MKCVYSNVVSTVMGVYIFLSLSYVFFPMLQVFLLERIMIWIKKQDEPMKSETL